MGLSSISASDLEALKSTCVTVYVQGKKTWQTGCEDKLRQKIAYILLIPMSINLEIFCIFHFIFNKFTILL